MIWSVKEHCRIACFQNEQLLSKEEQLDVIFQQENAPAHNRDNEEAAWEQVY